MPHYQPRAQLPTDHLHELAAIERLLRRDTRAFESHVDVDTSGACIWFRTAPWNPHRRGNLTAAVANEIALTDAWGLSTVHDPQRVDEGTQSLLTVVYVPEEADVTDDQDTVTVPVEAARVALRELELLIERTGHPDRPEADFDLALDHDPLQDDVFRARNELQETLEADR